MSLRVLRSGSQGRWKDGQPSWDLNHQRKKHQKNLNPYQEQAAGPELDSGSLYNAKGDLVPPVSSLEIDI